jgi:uncharacterized LabA/DUF88 family protein
MDEKLKFAVFIDFDNIEIGVKSTLGREFDVSLVLEALKERGEVVTKFAYGNWKMAGRHSEKMAAHAVHMIQRDPSPRGDKNGGDINLAMDALELAFSREFINAFCIVGGDSDFMSLVEKLKQYNKAVYIVGGRGFTSTILQKNCREFISYENLIGANDEAPSVAPESIRRPRGRSTGRTPSNRTPRGASKAPMKAAAPVAVAAVPTAAIPVAAPVHGRNEDSLDLSNVLPLLSRTLKVLADREHEPLLGLVKSTMIQLDSTFTERDYGVSSFLDFAEKLAAAGLVVLERRGGNYTLSMQEGDHPAPQPSGETREDHAINVLREVLKEAAQRGRREFHIHGLKQFLSKLRPGFDERKFGFKQFSALLNLAHDRGLVSIAPDERGAMRVRTLVDAGVPHAAEQPVVETAAESAAEMSEAFAQEQVIETVIAGEEVTVPIVPEPDEFMLEPAPLVEETPGPKRRRKAAATDKPKKVAKPRAPRKKKTDS